MVERDDPYLNFNFLVEFAGEVVAGFSEADLLRAAHDFL